ncbi:hypothetical protein [Nonomuraea sp. NPDC049480]|uniref:hypothetical protein n=1 Tax=Nonomuraea sp. NPDC049480 TaxID=3364353 RepID=UPI0037A46571
MLTHLGVTLSELGRPGDALTAEREAVTIRRQLAAADPARYRARRQCSGLQAGAD